MQLELLEYVRNYIPRVRLYCLNRGSCHAFVILDCDYSNGLSLKG